MSSVGNKIKLARMVHGDLTQQELADKISCSRQTIHSIETCKFLPSIELALKLAKALNTPIQELFYLDAKEKK